MLLFSFSVLGLKGPRRPPGWLWSRQGIVSQAGQPSRLPGTLASPEQVDFVVPILNLVWAGNYG